MARATGRNAVDPIASVGIVSPPMSEQNQWARENNKGVEKKYSDLSSFRENDK